MKRKPPPVTAGGLSAGGGSFPPAYGLEAVQAVDRPRACGHERHLGRLSTVGAHDVVHHARTPVSIRLPSRGAALGAPPRLVLEAPGLIELLLTGGEEGIPTPVAAPPSPIPKAHR